MKTIGNGFRTRLFGASALLILASPMFAREPAESSAAGRTILTFVNRLLINPPQVLAFGYFATIEGLPGPLFAGNAGENTAYFTWSLNAAGALQLPNGDPIGGVAVAILPSEESFNVYYNANPNQNWNNPPSFAAGQLVATFKSSTGTQTAAGPVALVTQSYTLLSHQHFTFKGETYSFSRLIPHGFTIHALSSNIPLGGATSPPLVFAATGSGVAIGGPR